MNTKIEDGGPAFPTSYSNCGASGLTVRQYTAIHLKHSMSDTPFKRTHCPNCHSENDLVLRNKMWDCGVEFNDPSWRTKECYKRDLAAVTKELAVSNADKNLFKASCDLANVLLNESVAREKIAIKSTWIPASTKPEGYERRLLLWVVWQGFGWRDQPEAKIGWWKHGPRCFAFDEFENADHLVTHWMEITDPTQAKEAL